MVKEFISTKIVGSVLFYEKKHQHWCLLEALGFMESLCFITGNFLPLQISSSTWADTNSF